MCSNIIYLTSRGYRTTFSVINKNPLKTSIKTCLFIFFHKFKMSDTTYNSSNSESDDDTSSDGSLSVSISYLYYL